MPGMRWTAAFVIHHNSLIDKGGGGGEGEGGGEGGGGGGGG